MRTVTRVVMALALVAAAALVVVSVHGTAGASSSINVTTYDYASTRTGDDPQTGTIAALANSASWTAGLDGAVYGEPLVDGARVYVATEDDTLYALSLTTGHVLWHLQLGTTVPTSTIDQATTLRPGCGDINPLGITGTPVISTSLNEIFVAPETFIGGTGWRDIRHELDAVSLSTHTVAWSRSVDPPGGNTSTGYWIPAEQQRPALTLVNDRVYVNFGGLSGDCGLYHGFVVGVPETGNGAIKVFQVPSYTEGAIWATNGAVVGANGDLFVATGNGYSTTTFDGGDALFRLSPTLGVVSDWAPPNWASLTQNDWDLGSAGPIGIPGTTDLFIAGKPEGSSGTTGYIVNANALGTGPGPALYSGRVCASLSQSAGVFGADAVATLNVDGVTRTYVYTACRTETEALLVHPGTHPTFTQAWTPSRGTPDGPPVYAGGLVWALDWENSGLYAMRPTTGYVVFSRPTAALDHFATPTVADGYVLVPTRTGVQAFAAS